MPTTPPGPRGLPLVGNTHQWLRDPLAFHDRIADRGRVVSYEALGRERYLLVEPGDVERVLVHEPDRFPKDDRSTDQLREVVGDGLLTSDGERWRSQRAAVGPAFTLDAVRGYGEAMVDRAAAAADRLVAGEPVDLHAEMTRTTLEILFDCLFGTDAAPGERGLYDAVDALQAPLEPENQPVTLFAPDWLPVPTLRRAERARVHLREQVDAMLAERRAGDGDRTDLLAMLVESDLPDETVRDQVLTFLFAGHETTALALTYAWDLLSRSPGAARRLRDELDATLDGPPTVADVFDLEYTEAVVREAMRLHPPAHQLRRQPTDDVTFGEYRVPAGSLLLLPARLLHRDGRFWDDPGTFRPGRWLEDADRPEFAYFPFGGGPRHCIGRRFAMLETQLVLATVARRWRFEREYGDLSFSAAVTLKPTTDVVMTPRRVT